jgi:hydrogenase small subunit
MQLSRREFLKAAAALGLTAVEFSKIQEAVASNGDPPVIWLQGQGCTGCSVSFLNSVYYATVDELLLNSISLEYDSTVMASAGAVAMAAASTVRPSPMEKIAYNNEVGKTGTNLQMDLNGDGVVDSLDYTLLSKRGYILIVEGAIPTKSKKACTIGNGLTMLDAFKIFAKYASAIIAVGTCASFGGISAGKPNPTGAKSVKNALAAIHISKPLINIPGCPVHPDWVVGTLSYFLVNGKAPLLDSSGRPTDYFGKTVHSACPNLSSYSSNYAGRAGHGGNKTCLSCHANTDGHIRGAKILGQSGCLYALNCKGMSTYCDCPTRGWNSPAKNTTGVNWCIAAKAPCNGCTQPNFPDGMSPFYTLSGRGVGDGSDD